MAARHTFTGRPVTNQHTRDAQIGKEPERPTFLKAHRVISPARNMVVAINSYFVKDLNNNAVAKSRADIISYRFCAQCSSPENSEQAPNFR